MRCGAKYHSAWQKKARMRSVGQTKTIVRGYKLKKPEFFLPVSTKRLSLTVVRITASLSKEDYQKSGKRKG